MKKAVKWFSKLSRTLQIVIVLLLVGFIVLVCVIVYKAVTTGIKSFNDIMGAVGLGEREATAKQKEDTTKDFWTANLAERHPDEVTLMPSQLKQMATDIYDSWGYVHANFDKTMNAFKKCHNKVDVSALVKAFSDQYSKDLNAFLSTSYWNLLKGYRLTDEQYLTLHNFVNSLPNE